MYERRVGAVEPPHIGGGRKGVDVSFASFLCAKEKEGKKGFFSLHQRKRGKEVKKYKKRRVKEREFRNSSYFCTKNEEC